MPNDIGSKCYSRSKSCTSHTCRYGKWIQSRFVRSHVKSSKKYDHFDIPNTTGNIGKKVDRFSIINVNHAWNEKTD